MANKKALTKEQEDQAQKWGEEGLNKTEIASRFGISRGALDRIEKERGFKFPLRIHADTLNKEIIFLEALKTCPNWTSARKFAGLARDTAYRIMVSHNLTPTNHSDAAKEKCLSIKEVNLRIPEGLICIGMESSNPVRYLIQTSDGFIFKKTSAKLHQGDPRGQSGTRTNFNTMSRRLAEIGYDLLNWEGSVKGGGTVRCSVGHIRSVEGLQNLITKQSRCPDCGLNGTSYDELNVKSLIDGWGIKTEKFNFPERITKPKSIDIYVPDLKVGIEFCGLYWHSERQKNLIKARRQHWNKMKNAEKLGIRLITIFEDEWYDRRPQVIGFLKSVFGKNEISIGARKCELKEIQKEQARKFLDEYHIQGSKDVLSVAFGLFYNEDLVGVITGANHHRGVSKDLILDRLCFKANVTISGGASRLLSSLKSWGLSNGYNRILSWSDNRWSTGGVYIKTGFRLAKDWPPDYSYEKSNKRFSKQSRTKKKLRKLGAVGEKERDMAISIGLYRIWDCGKKRWEMDL